MKVDVVEAAVGLGPLHRRSSSLAGVSRDLASLVGSRNLAGLLVLRILPLGVHNLLVKKTQSLRLSYLCLLLCPHWSRPS